MMFACEKCGRETKRKSSTQKYCPECGRAIGKEQRRKTALAAYYRREEAKKLSLEEPIIRCEKCGGLTPGGHGRRFCPTCARQRKIERSAEENKKLLKPDESSAEKPKYTRPRRTGQLFDLGGKDLAEVALEARALGMTYGEYTSACFGGTIEQRLACYEGLDREKASKMISAAKRKRTAAKKKKKAS